MGEGEREGTSHGDMARHSVAVALLAKVSKGRGHVLLHPLSLGIDIGECGDPPQLEGATTCTPRQGLEGLIVGGIAGVEVVVDGGGGGNDGEGALFRRGSLGNGRGHFLGQIMGAMK